MSKINLSNVKCCCKLANSRRFRFSARHFATEKKYFPVKRDCMLPEGCFKGNVAFVTGGGTGLGKGMVKMLSERGATVVISSRYTICSFSQTAKCCLDSWPKMAIFQIIEIVIYRELENVLNFLNCACMNAEIGQTAFKDVIHNESVVLNKQPKIQWWPQLSSAFMNCCYITGGIDFGQ